MKTKIIPIVALLVLAIIAMVPADKVKFPDFGKFKSTFGGNSQSHNPNGVGGIGGGRGGGNRIGGGVIQTINEKVNYSQVRPGRYDENDHWGYDNKYYRKVDRNYQLNMFDDLKLDNKNIRGLLGRSKVDINLYNKGLFNSGYGSVEILVISYDEYGDYLGERIEVMPHCICKSDKLSERLGISRNTDEVIVKILHAEPCTCRDWYEKASRKKEKEQKRVNDEVKREKEKQYKQWERKSSRENKDDQRNTYDNRQTSNNNYSESSNRQTSYNRDRQSKNQPLFGRNRNKQKTEKVIYCQECDYEDDYYEKESRQRGGESKREKPPKPKKQKGIPDDVQVRERGPIHVDFCDCRKCRYDRSAPSYEFSKKTY